MTKYVAVWIDHKEARLFSLAPENTDETKVMAQLDNPHHRASNGQEGLKEHPEDAKRFFHEVVEALAGAEEILIVGPGTAKLDLLKYVHTHDHGLELNVVGVETVDHPTDGQLVAYAKKYFKKADQMR